MAWIRWVRSSALLALVAMVIAACGGSGGGSSSNSATVNRSGTITIWHNWQGGYLDAKKAIFDAYMKQYPNVTINLVHKDDIATAGAQRDLHSIGELVNTGQNISTGFFAEMQLFCRHSYTPSLTARSSLLNHAQ